jgi:trk system potassium uptake protein TrkA
VARVKEKVFAVIGLGSFGRKVSEVLASRGGKVIVIDSDASRIEKVKNQVTQAVIMDATEEEAFGKIPLEDVDIALVAIGDNIEGSILSTALLKQRGVPYIISRALNSIHRQVLLQVGADEIINLEEDEGEQLATRLIAPQILDRTPLSEDISIAEVYCPEEFYGKTLIEINLRERLQLNVVAVKRINLDVDEEGNSKRSDQLIFPEGDTNLLEDDIIIVVGYNENIEALKQI